VIVSRIALAAGIVVLGFVCWLAVVGSGAATELLVTVVAIVVLVAGGNWLAGRSHHGRAAPPGATAGAVAPHDKVEPTE
jgi:hypothetical protein